MDDSTPPTRVLLLEDSEIDAELVSEHIGRSAGHFHIDWVHDRASFEKALNDAAHDIILADYSLPDFDGLTALDLTRKSRPHTPFIFVSGVAGEEFATNAITRGATDYVVKRNLSRLPAAIERALAESHERSARLRAQQALLEREAQLREINETLEAKVKERTHELMQMEATLRQSQKMEAVGQLTGGIAHDFNNLLAAITGSLELIERRLAQGRSTGLERYLGAAQDAARRAAALTQRLLAFSRRQTLDPHVIDANKLIAGMEDLIRRSVGPDVSVEVVGAGGLWNTRVDVSQLENSLLNLCINARDAMLPDGGRLTIETANKWLDERAARERELSPGQYISLCVTDTGSGMSSEVIERAFDPFFTTKPLGVGTGLGLSMVYGFVRQSGGQVRIYSEAGKGTTVCLYLPRFFGTEDNLYAAGTQPLDQGAGETVLVVDDEPAIRMIIAEILQDNGYTALEAADGAGALRILESEIRIDLLITDVGLPGGINGRQVADAARVTRPQLKVLFITGFAENAAFRSGHLAPGMEVVTKPFEMAALATKIHDLINRQ
jgi:signal transduction histidine kinase